MAETPPGSFPIVGENVVVRVRLGALISAAVFIAGLLIGGTLWASGVINRLDDLSRRMARFEKAVGLDLATIPVSPLRPSGP